MSKFNDSIRFDFEDYIENELGLHIEEDIYCDLYQTNQCHNKDCDKQHIKLATSVICKHWLRGLCKKNKKCEFIHEYDLKKMPQCYFFSKLGECTNPECFYLHSVDKRKECAWYNRGFCRHGSTCKNRHVQKKMCYNYFLGFCIKGPNCEFGHPKAYLFRTKVT
ncbi:cleavage and polyadenylation specific factor 30kda [Vairimorpha apis BRL 01]|uniref:mRNA 3'-end-processing protein n=1 Tax=Vairimorpha apis BRL 01 TaxID=1037528 RepID=T0L227_9MICR|nr:cleavage and polyadenylation specific factor 30kda [Vairimorpha apis BRL 01]